VLPNGLDGDAELDCDLAVCETFHKQPQDVQLALRKGLVGAIRLRRWAYVRRVRAVRAYSRVTVAGEKCKRIIQLYYGRELTLNQMVEETGYSRKTIWKRIWDCLQRMREGAP